MGGGHFGGGREGVSGLGRWGGGCGKGGGCMGSFQSDFDNLAEKVSIVCALMMFLSSAFHSLIVLGKKVSFL